MKISKSARRDAKQLFQSCLADGQLEEGRVRQVVAAVIERKPRGYLPALVHFQRLVKLELDRRTAVVESAVELGSDLQAGVRERLMRMYGGRVAIQYRVNPGLIGGLRVRVGSDFYDGSVEARLAALRETF